jgi:hypothetical protein
VLLNSTDSAFVPLSIKKKTQLTLLFFLSTLQENIPLEEVFENLRCSREGLSTQQAQQRLEIFGPNKLEEKEVCFNSRHYSLCFFPPTLLEKTHVIIA